MTRRPQRGARQQSGLHAQPWSLTTNITGTAGATASGPWVARVSASTPATPSVDLVLIGDAYGGGAIDDVDNTDDDVLIKIGTAFEEFSSKPDATHIQPAEVLNYIQHFRNTWAVGDYTEQLDVYGVPELALQAEESIGKHRLDVERSSWFGLYLAENDTTVQPTYYSGGVNEYLTTNLVLYAGVLADWEYGDLVDDAGAVFQYKAGETKLMFAGTEVMNRMGNPSWQGAGDTVYTNVQNNRDLLSEIFGMRIKEIVLPNGNLRVIPHYEVFVDRIAPTTPGLISKQCYILDIRQLRAMTLRNKGIGMIEMNIQDAGQHGRMDGVYSYFGLEFKHEKRHARIQFTS